MFCMKRCPRTCARRRSETAKDRKMISSLTGPTTYVLHPTQSSTTSERTTDHLNQYRQLPSTTPCSNSGPAKSIHSNSIDLNTSGPCTGYKPNLLRTSLTEDPPPTTCTAIVTAKQSRQVTKTAWLRARIDCGLLRLTCREMRSPGTR